MWFGAIIIALAVVWMLLVVSEPAWSSPGSRGREYLELSFEAFVVLVTFWTLVIPLLLLAVMLLGGGRLRVSHTEARLQMIFAIAMDVVLISLLARWMHLWRFGPNAQRSDAQ